MPVQQLRTAAAKFVTVIRGIHTKQIREIVLGEFGPYATMVHGRCVTDQARTCIVLLYSCL
jgi:hypothetical protein